jgi:hypothetical protein
MDAAADIVLEAPRESALKITFSQAVAHLESIHDLTPGPKALQGVNLTKLSASLKAVAATGRGSMDEDEVAKAWSILRDVTLHVALLGGCEITRSSSWFGSKLDVRAVASRLDILVRSPQPVADTQDRAGVSEYSKTELLPAEPDFLRMKEFWEPAPDLVTRLIKKNDDRSLAQAVKYLAVIGGHLPQATRLVPDDALGQSAVALIGASVNRLGMHRVAHDGVYLTGLEIFAPGTNFDNCFPLNLTASVAREIAAGSTREEPLTPGEGARFFHLLVALSDSPQHFNTLAGVLDGHQQMKAMVHAFLGRVVPALESQETQDRVLRKFLRFTQPGHRHG